MYFIIIVCVVGVLLLLFNGVVYLIVRADRQLYTVLLLKTMWTSFSC